MTNRKTNIVFFFLSFLPDTLIVLELDNVDPRAFGYRLLSESDLTLQLTTTSTTSSDQHSELLTA